MKHVATAVLLALAVALTGCGGDDVDDVRDRADRLRDDVAEEFERRREEVGRRLEEVLGELQRIANKPGETSPDVRSGGAEEPKPIDAFLTSVLGNVDRYWKRIAGFAGLPEPSVAHEWIRPGATAETECPGPADDAAAFYCPLGDTIYIGQAFAADVQGSGGDFAVAYLVAHEYAHNLQQELGVLNVTPGAIADRFELQADCLAGVWAYSAFAAGDLEPGALERAADTRDHATPAERREALREGFEEGNPRTCLRYTESR